MTYTEAVKEARRRWRSTDRPMYVVRVLESDGGPYQDASDFDLETFYSGAEVVCAVDEEL